MGPNKLLAVRISFCYGEGKATRRQTRRVKFVLGRFCGFINGLNQLASINRLPIQIFYFLKNYTQRLESVSYKLFLFSFCCMRTWPVSDCCFMPQIKKTFQRKELAINIEASMLPEKKGMGTPKKEGQKERGNRLKERKVRILCGMGSEYCIVACILQVDR